MATTPDRVNSTINGLGGVEVGFLSAASGNNDLRSTTEKQTTPPTAKQIVQMSTLLNPPNIISPAKQAALRNISSIDGTLSSRKPGLANDDTLMNLCKQIWRNADAVCFDVDSTVCRDEAIDELAKYVGKAKEVSEITKEAMQGGANFREALAKRLEIIQPSYMTLAQYLTNHQPKLTDFIEELVARLHQLGVDVYLISGGFDAIIQPAAEKLGIPMRNVFANSIKFYSNGSYAGFDQTRPTSNQDGKSRVIAVLKQTKGYKNVVMVGDGVTDLEACPPADAFIGFGGNQVREAVRDNCYWFVYSFKELITELPYCDRNLRPL